MPCLALNCIQFSRNYCYALGDAHRHMFLVILSLTDGWSPGLYLKIRRARIAPSSYFVFGFDRKGRWA
jgi:hypothetical protein